MANWGLAWVLQPELTSAKATLPLMGRPLDGDRVGGRGSRVLLTWRYPSCIGWSLVEGCGG